MKGIRLTLCSIGLIATGAYGQGGETIGDAVVIGALPYSDTGSTVTAINDYDEVCPYTGSLSNDVVYAFTPGADMALDITLCNGSDYDTKLYIYENAHTPNAPFACNDDSCPGFVSELMGVVVYAGNTYYIVIDGYGSANGNYVLDVTEGVMPQIEECEPDVLFGQIPTDPEGNWSAGTSDANTTQGYKRWDDYSTGAPIESLTFWGMMLNFNAGWFDCPTENPMDFEIAFYADEAGMPAASPDCLYNVTVLGEPTSYFWAGFPVYRFSVSLGSACGLTSGWMSIQGTSLGTPDCWLLWCSSGDAATGSSWFYDGTGMIPDTADLSMCLYGGGGPSCPEDVNGDSIVDVLDLLAVLAAWGATGGAEDINGDGIVDVLDLLALLAAWGPC